MIPQDENRLLKDAIAQYGEKNWKKVCEGGPPARPHPHSLLAPAALSFTSRGRAQIAEQIPGRTSVQCLQHWKHVLHPDVGKGTWTQEEVRAGFAWRDPNAAALLTRA